jgi:hypothetical protein
MMAKEGLYKKPTTSVSTTLKQAVWDMYVGIGVQKTLCMLCGINYIYSNVNSGFECAHIVARSFLTENVSVYYLFPSCDVCNNQCRDFCVFDFLWCRNRLAPLRKAVMAVYLAYVTEHEAQLAAQDRLIHLVLDHLYGEKRFPLGGGIVNKKQIYELARDEQFEWLRQKSARLEGELVDVHQQRKWLMEAAIKPGRLQ